MSTTTHTGFGGLVGQRSPMAGHATVIDRTQDPVEAITRAGLDWSVSKRPLWFTGKSNGSKPIKVAGHFATVRDDSERLLGTVKAGYTPVQNAEAFAWADGLGDFVFAGAMRDGAQTYLGVELRQGLELAGDATNLYLVLWNGHDGSKSLGGAVTPVRMRCMNQLGYAKSVAVGKWFARHTARVLDKAQASHDELLGLVNDHVTHLQVTADRLAHLKVSRDRARQLLEAALPGRVRLIDEVLGNLDATDTLDDVQRNTGWGVLQATTEYFEWRRAARSTESALQTTLDGVGARTARALERTLVAA